MRIFTRSSSGPRPEDVDRNELRDAISGVVVLPEADVTPAMRMDRRARLLRIVAEAVILQDEAEELLARVRAREPLSELAPRSGPLARRFFELRRRLPLADDGEMDRQCETAARVLDHHGTVLTYALELLAMDWRSDAIASQLERLDGLGEPAERLDTLYAELAR
jgi:hypothetical protein